MLRRLCKRFAPKPALPTAEPRHPAPVWLRGERLRLMYEMEGAEPAVDTAQIIECGYFDPDRYDKAVVHGIEYADYALFRAMQDVAVEQRERQYAALELLATLVNAEPDPSVDARWCAAIAHDADTAASCMEELGWIAAAPDGK